MDDGLMSDEQFIRIVDQWVTMLERKTMFIRFQFIRTIQKSYTKRGVFPFMGEDIGFREIGVEQARELLADALLQISEFPPNGNRNLLRSYQMLARTLEKALIDHTVA